MTLTNDVQAALYRSLMVKIRRRIRIARGYGDVTTVTALNNLLVCDAAKRKEYASAHPVKGKPEWSYAAVLSPEYYYPQDSLAGARQFLQQCSADDAGDDKAEEIETYVVRRRNPGDPWERVPEEKENA